MGDVQKLGRMLEEQSLETAKAINRARRAEAKLEAMERTVDAFDIQGVKSWAQTIVDEWERGERDYSATKVAEKILAGLAAAQEDQ